MESIATQNNQRAPLSEVNALASPHDDGTVSISVTTTWNRAKWKEFRSQVDQLFDIAEQKGKA